MSPTVPPFADLMAPCRHSAVHLEMRDVYYGNDEYEAWKRGTQVDWDDRASWWSEFNQQVADAVARGVIVRRARVVSEPVSDYIRWEHYVTHANLAAGEQVRWLPRRQATDLGLPGNDYWIFDGSLLRIGYFSGDGDLVGHELSEDPGVIRHCADAFEAVWERAIRHDEYRV
jgi:hypothetical protein